MGWEVVREGAWKQWSRRRLVSLIRAERCEMLLVMSMLQRSKLVKLMPVAREAGKAVATAGRGWRGRRGVLPMQRETVRLWSWGPWFCTHGASCSRAEGLEVWRVRVVMVVRARWRQL